MDRANSTNGKETHDIEFKASDLSMIEEVPGENEATAAMVEGDLKNSNVPKPFHLRLKTDRRFRRQVLHTFCVALAGIAACWHITIIGVTLPDIMLIIDKDLSTSSWILTAISVGNLVGALSIGVLYDRFNKLLVLVGINMGIAITSLVTPWCANFVAMLIIHVVGGTFAVAGHSVCTADTLFVWGKDSGPYLLLIHFAISLGGAVGPLVSEPFLAKRIARHAKDTTYMINTSSIETSTDDYYPSLERLKSTPAFMNETNIGLKMLTTTPGGLSDMKPSLHSVTVAYQITNQTSNRTKDMALETSYGETHIVVAYSILAAFCILVVLLFVISTVTQGNVYNMKISQDKPENNENKTTSKQKLSRVCVTVFVILQALLITLYVTIQKHLSGFFMIFVIDELNWSKTAGSNASAVFWIAFGISRLSAVLVVQKWQQHTLFIVYTGTFTIGIATLIAFSFLNVLPGLFVSCAIWGFGMAPLLAFMFTWLSSNVTMVTGKVTSVIYTFISLSGMISPLISGYLMETLSFNWFLYITGIYAVCFIALHAFIQIVFKVLNK